MYGIYASIYHQYTPNVSIYIYIPYMDPMGYDIVGITQIRTQRVSNSGELAIENAPGWIGV